MAPGPPDREANRFAILSPKRKKRENTKTLPLFPALPSIQKPNPRYVVISATNDKKPLSHYSCFAVNKSFQIISKGIISISELRDGSLLLLLESKAVAEKFIKCKELTGICSINAKYQENLNSTKGTVFAPYLNNIPENEIVEELASQGVISAYKFQKRENGKTYPSGVVLLTFDLYHLPEKIDISWRSVKTREYIPNPMRCRHCQKLGHTKKWCKNPPSCDNCNLPPHQDTSCTRTFCANCSEEHPASSRQCTKFIQAKKLIEIKTKNKCSMREAIQIQKEEFPSFTSSSTTYSAVTKLTENTNSLLVTSSDSKIKAIETTNNNINNNNLHFIDTKTKPTDTQNAKKTIFHSTPTPSTSHNALNLNDKKLSSSSLPKPKPFSFEKTLSNNNTMLNKNFVNNTNLSNSNNSPNDVLMNGDL